MHLELTPVLTDDDYDFIATVLDSTISEHSAALAVLARTWAGESTRIEQTHIYNRLQSTRAIAADIRAKIEARV